MSPDDLMNLPWQMQVALASGYAAYMLSSTGIRQHHSAIETTLSSLLFGLIATVVLKVFGGSNPIAAGGAAFFASCAFALIWRKYLSSGIYRVLRAANLTWSDDKPSVWATIMSNSKNPVSQISVLVDDGTWLRCHQTTCFADLPFGPCQLGATGDVALFVTHVVRPGGKEEAIEDISNDGYGHQITYVPASRICRVAIRFVNSK